MKTAKGFNSTERGEGQIGSLIMLGVFIALAIAATQVGPIYWDNYQFEDRLTNIAGRFPPTKESDARARWLPSKRPSTIPAWVPILTSAPAR